MATWPPHSQETVACATGAAAAVSTGVAANQGAGNGDRPHTISTAYEKGGHHQRPALTVYTFQSPEITPEAATAQKSPATNLLCRPPLPIVNIF